MALINEGIWLLRNIWLQMIGFASVFMYSWIVYRGIKYKVKLAFIPIVAVLITVYQYYQYSMTANIMLVPGLIILFCCAALVLVYCYFELSLEIALKLIFPVIILVMLGSVL